MKRSRNHCSRRNAISNYYFECVSLALPNRHAMRMFRIILSPVACLALPSQSLTRHNFRRKVTNIKNMFSFYLYFCCPKYFSLLEGLFGVLS